MQADRTRRTTVAVRPEAELRARPRLFAALEAAFEVDFAADRGGEAEATIAIGEEAPDNGMPALVLGRGSGSPPRRAAVRLADCEMVDERIRGISILDPLDAPAPNPSGESPEVLASSGSRAAWTRTKGSPSTDRVASSLPELEPPQTLRELLDEHPLALIAVVEFIRGLDPAYASSRPASRAAILFDDPNLRWRTYGFIDYGQLLAHADAHGYHASMAMIPLDGGRQHRATVGLFRGRPDRLSLAFHGNDHIAAELMRVENDEEAASVVAQALRRAIRFESRYGLGIDRVMTAPHGMCSAAAAGRLAPLGFDALCAIHPLPWSEHPPAGRPLAGWRPAEFAAGCAVIPRLPLSVDGAEIALRAYLDQPVILYGHHEDLAGGLDLLAEKAAIVNRLGTVRWSGLGEIAASNNDSRLRDGVLHVRPYSHRLQVPLAKGVKSLAVERPSQPDADFAGWTTGSGLCPFDMPVPVFGRRVELRLVPCTALDPAGVPAPRSSFWPVLRRAATETRDRLRPLARVGPA
jgi:hypothetical protein